MLRARKLRVPLAFAALAVAIALIVALPALDDDSARPAAHPHGARASRPSSPPASPATQPTLLAARRPAGTPVNVIVAAQPVGTATPPDYLGLSFELRSLPLLARYATEPRTALRAAPTATGARAGDLVALLRSLGPGVLRLGGVSADEQAAWVGPGEAPARGTATAIDARDLAGLATLMHETGWRVLLTVDLGHYDPAAATREAAAAHTALGPALAGIEIGNEPDRYVRKGLRAPGWDFAAYRAQATAYTAAIAAAAPGVAIAGPDPSSGVPSLAWLRAAARTLRPQLLTEHYYPLSSCGYRPTVAELLSPGVRGKDGALLARMLAIAHAARTPLRIDEVGSVSCEGFPGVSDTFASALWALDYTVHALAAGAAGLNFHDLLSKPAAYSPLVAPTPAALAAGALRAQPEWYALLAARELPGSRPLPTSITGAAPGELDASAFRAPDGRLRLVLIDYAPPGSPPLAVSLRVPRAPGGASRTAAARARTRGGVPSAYTSGSVLRLTGPSPTATAGVRLAGRAVAPDGSWTAPSALPAVYGSRGALSLQLAPNSAAVVTLYPR